MTDQELLTRLMADFEQGHSIGDDNPFDATDWQEIDADLLNAVVAFSEGGASDTRKNLRQLQESDPSDKEDAAFVIAGLLQGLAIGYAYAQAQKEES